MDPFETVLVVLIFVGDNVTPVEPLLVVLVFTGLGDGVMVESVMFSVPDGTVGPVETLVAVIFIKRYKEIVKYMHMIRNDQKWKCPFIGCSHFI